MMNRLQTGNMTNLRSSPSLYAYCLTSGQKSFRIDAHTANTLFSLLYGNIFQTSLYSIMKCAAVIYSGRYMGDDLVP